MAYNNASRSRAAAFQPTPVSERAPLFELRGGIVDVGILRDTLLPSLALHSGLSLIAYGLGRSQDRVEAKDWLWPSAQIINAWWASVGRRVVYGNLSLGQALTSLSRPEYLLLGGVTIWGGRLFYRIATRSQARGGDDPRYEAVKKQPDFWNDALWKIFLPEALFQTVISLPLTAPFYHQGGVFTGYHPWMQIFSIAVFGTGLAMEVLADAQLDTFKESGKDEHDINKEGVWSIVRHPKYVSPTTNPISPYH